MKILHITTSTKGGAGIAALRLHQALCNNGVASGFLSSNLTIDFNNQIVEDSFFKYHKPSVLKRIHYKLKKHFFSSESQKSIQYFNDIKEKMSFGFYMGALLIVVTVILNGIVKHYFEDKE